MSPKTYCLLRQVYLVKSNNDLRVSNPQGIVSIKIFDFNIH